MNLEKWSACIVTVFCLSNTVFAQWSPKEGPLMTPWGEQLKANQVHKEYPRPQLVRPEWINLNGVWEYAITGAMADAPAEYDGEILVPFPVESALSGVMKRVLPEDLVWYRRSFAVPQEWGNRRVLLHFGAVDWESRVWVNGRKAGDHRGGYDAFSFDITDLLNPEGENDLLVAVWDPTNTGTQGRGKQVLNPGGIMYTAVTGIWQTVWLEPVSEVSIASLRIVPDIDEGTVSIRALTRPNAANARVEVVVRDASGRRAGRADGPASDAVAVALPDAKLWSPDEPYLYQLDIQLMVDGAVQDEVGSYFGMRKISLGKDEKGLTRIMLNNEFVFQVGPLDQGWWPDGLYTAPSDTALRYDLEMTKKLGFNMLRKHVKVEPARLYYWADRLGLLVWQDMPSGDRGIGGNDPDIRRTAQSARQYYLELKAMIDGLYNHPSIIMWVPFNEGWGQFNTEEVVEYIQVYDPTRLVNNASGWTDRGVGDVNDVHRYPGPGAPEPEEDRAAVLGEFGGLGLPLEGHTWQSSANWGYVSFQNSEELTDAYVGLFQAMQPLIHEGLSAAVYTQTTDVEVEVNGLMTYDRKIVKMDPTRVALANRGYVPPSFGDTPDIFIDSATVVLNPPISGGEIRYTLDGSAPDAASQLYIRPIILNATASVSARTFWPEGKASETVSRNFSKVKPVPGVELADPKPGLNYAVFEGPFRALPDFEILDAVETGVADRVSIDIAGRPENFALAFEGFFRVDKDDAFTFFLNSDDGTRMWIDGEKIIENDGVHGMTEVSGSVALKAGYHPIRIEYFQGVGGSGLIFDAATSGSGRTSVPPDALFHR